MTAPNFLRAFSFLALCAIALPSQATAINACNAATQTNVDCDTVFGAVETEYGVNFATATDYHVGYRAGVGGSPDFLDNSMSVSTHSVFATSIEELNSASAVDGNTMMIEFDAESELSGMVLSGLNGARGDNGDFSDTLTQSAQIVAYNEAGEKVFDQIVQGESGYVYINFGDIVPLISTLFISSGGGLPGVTSTNADVAYFITPLPEPGTLLLFVTGVGFLIARRKLQA